MEGEIMSNFVKGVLFTLLVVYVISPMDFAPGPIDDVLAIILFLAANRNKLKIGRDDNGHIDMIDMDRTEV